MVPPRQRICGAQELRTPARRLSSARTLTRTLTPDTWQLDTFGLVGAGGFAVQSLPCTRIAHCCKQIDDSCCNPTPTV